MILFNNKNLPNLPFPEQDQAGWSISSNNACSLIGLKVITIDISRKNIYMISEQVNKVNKIIKIFKIQDPYVNHRYVEGTLKSVSILNCLFKKWMNEVDVFRYVKSLIYASINIYPNLYTEWSNLLFKTNLFHMSPRFTRTHMTFSLKYNYMINTFKSCNYMLS